MTLIIAEAGVNHNGSMETAFKLIDAAKEIGVDCIKFQTFQAENIVTKSSPKAFYQLNVTDKSESQYEMLKKLELGKEDFLRLKQYCDVKKIMFMSTPYNYEDVDLLNEIGVEAFKIASGQLVELPFLRYIARLKKKMIISTGMANLAEVYYAVEAIRSEGNDNVIVLQCNTDYPSKIEDTNILAMNTMQKALNVKVGYSDHVVNNYACYAAVALGAEVIEKHFTLDKNMEGPDHSCSLEPKEFKELIDGIRNIEMAMGTGVKTPSLSEQKNTFGMRRSIVAKIDIKKDEILSEKHFAYKRPANGLSPNIIEQFIGKKMLKDIFKDQPFTMNHIL